MRELLLLLAQGEREYEKFQRKVLCAMVKKIDQEMTGGGAMIRVGVLVRCTACGRMKKPVGRSAPLCADYCDHECEGYRSEPRPGSLWPGETSEDLGYPVGEDGTELRRTT